MKRTLFVSLVLFILAAACASPAPTAAPTTPSEQLQTVVATTAVPTNTPVPTSSPVPPTAQPKATNTPMPPATTSPTQPNPTATTTKTSKDIQLKVIATADEDGAISILLMKNEEMAQHLGRYGAMGDVLTKPSVYYQWSKLYSLKVFAEVKSKSVPTANAVLLEMYPNTTNTDIESYTIHYLLCQGRVHFDQQGNLQPLCKTL